MDWHKSKLGSQAGRRLDHRPLQTTRLEGAGGVHAPLQHQVGGLSVEPEVASRNRKRRAPSKRYQARQLGIKPHDETRLIGFRRSTGTDRALAINTPTNRRPLCRYPPRTTATADRSR